MKNLTTIPLMLVFTVLPMALMAQTDPGTPCDDLDPYDNNCPLDSWVYFIVLAPLAITLVMLYFRGEAVRRAEEEKELFVEAEEQYFEPAAAETAEGHDLAA